MILDEQLGVLHWLHLAGCQMKQPCYSLQWSQRSAIGCPSYTNGCGSTKVCIIGVWREQIPMHTKI
jgi:hypothetical protein